MSASYSYYATEYGGNSIPEMDFPAFIKRADLYLDSYTMGRINDNLPPNVLDKVYMAECAIAEKCYSMSKSSAITSIGEIASESVGSYSRSFRSGAEIIAEAEAGIKNLAMRYLGSTGLMYRGIPCTRHT